MPSRSRSAAAWLLNKEWRELRASKAWWVLLLATGPIVGVSFTNAVRTYADVSSDPGCGIACSPLLGIWAPTFGAYEIVAIFLLPFVAIRSLTGDRQSGALTLELQRPFPMAARVAIKGLVVWAGWAMSGAAAATAVGLWSSYGGSVDTRELAVVATGHALNAAMTIAAALAVAAMSDHPSTAAIVMLGLTIGTWMIDFAAAVYGGFWTRLSSFTPSAFVNVFQHGLVRTSALLVAIVLVAAGVAAAAVWIRLRRRTGQRLLHTSAVVLAAVVTLWIAGLATPSWDLSESRVNSFERRDEAALESIAEPIRIDVHLAPQDARRPVFDRGPLAKLRRVRPDAEVVYLARTATGLYEQADPGYGEIRYSVGGRSAVTRAITDEALVETMLTVAGVAASGPADDPYRGHPLFAHPTGAPLAFFLFWPAIVGGLWFWSARRHS